MITVRKPTEIYQAGGEIEAGTFSGRWNFSFDQYRDSRYMNFGLLRVFNDDTLSAGAVWPLHPHSNIEVVTYCAEGEFRHADEHGKGGVLKKGWVQHTTVGSGMWHSEINNRKDAPLRFVQMWFLPSGRNLKPSVEQKKVEKEERTNKLFPLASNKNPEALKIFSDVEVYSCFLAQGKAVGYTLKAGRGVYLYVLEGGPVMLNNNLIREFGAAEITDEKELSLTASKDAEFLLVDTAL
ncbi:MAG: pirin family protein [Candidatus Omnitrophica bacterium]|nr:pirin family protein [Candidatus Omnitrophota bacterium]